MFLNIFAEVAGLAVFDFAAVSYLKQVGVSGRWLTISGFLVGLVVGVAYKYATQPMQDFPSWFYAVIYGLASGFVATGAYKGGESLAEKAKS